MKLVFTKSLLVLSAVVYGRIERFDWRSTRRISTIDHHRRRCGVVIGVLVYVRSPAPGDGSRPKLVNKDDGNVRAARRRVVVVIVVSRRVFGKMKWKRVVRFATAQESAKDIAV